MRRYRLKIADHPVELRLPTDGLSAEVEARYGGFMTDEDPRTVIEITFPDSLRDVVDAGPASAVCAGAEIRYWRNDLRAEVEPDFSRVVVAMRETVYALDAALRIFYSVLLIRSGGLLLHAASVGIDGQAFVFAGPTESGKSEVSRMGMGNHLTDELTPIRASGGGFVAYGSPFWGLFEKGGLNVGLPIGAVLCLVRGPRSEAVPLSPAHATRHLARCVLNFSREPRVADTVFSTLSRLVRSVPHARLESPPDERLWDEVRRFVAHRSAPRPHA